MTVGYTAALIHTPTWTASVIRAATITGATGIIGTRAAGSRRKSEFRGAFSTCARDKCAGPPNEIAASRPTTVRTMTVDNSLVGGHQRIDFGRAERAEGRTLLQTASAGQLRITLFRKF